MALLEIDDLKVGFDTEAGLLVAVDGVSFTIDQGRTLGPDFAAARREVRYGGPLGRASGHAASGRSALAGPRPTARRS
jgi:hypothetical protein